MRILKKIGILSAGYTLAILYSIFGFLEGLAFALQIRNPSLITEIDTKVAEILSNLGSWIFLILPISGILIGLIAGFIGGVIIAFLYNSVARFSGGIKIELVESSGKK